MLLLGIPLESDDVVWLADELTARGFPDLASALLRADGSGADIATLTLVEREAIVRVLDNEPPQRLVRLRRAALLNDQVDRPT